MRWSHFLLGVNGSPQGPPSGSLEAGTASRPWQLLFPPADHHWRQMLGRLRSPTLRGSETILHWPFLVQPVNRKGLEIERLCLCVCVHLHMLTEFFAQNNTCEGVWKAKLTGSRWPAETIERAIKHCLLMSARQGIDFLALTWFKFCVNKQCFHGTHLSHTEAES